MLSRSLKNIALFIFAGVVVAPAFAAPKEYEGGEIVSITKGNRNVRYVEVSGDASVSGWALKAINAHGAFDVKAGAPLKLRFTKAGANSVTVTASGSENWTATANGSSELDALWRAVDAAIVAAGKKFAVKPMFAATKLAFVRETGANRKEIYVGDLMLPTANSVTSLGSLSYSPNWSPDGSAIYFTSHFKSGAADVYRTGLGGGVSPVATYKGTNTGGAVSPDGSRVALSLSPKGTLDIYVAGADGRNPHAIVSTGDVESSPCWSPDGTRIAYTGGVSGRPQIMIVPANGGVSRKVSTGGYATEPSWNPVNTNQIAYAMGNCAGIGVADLGGASFQVEVSGAQSVSHPSWCADGRHVVVTIGAGKVTKVGLLDTQSGKLVVLSGSQFGNCSEPAARIAK